VQHCTECHGAEVQENGLRLDRRESALEGGDNGPVIIPGKVDQSPLIDAVRRTDADLAMPPDHPLPAETVAVLEKWIELGAAWPKSDEAPVAVDPVTRTDEIRKSHWAFQPLANPALPVLTNDDWSRNDIDRFVLDRLRATGLSPSPEADRRTLIRRAYYDLTGLPPSHQEVLDFIHDPAEDAYEQLIDRILAMPQYGERWARHWLDVARYSDTKGYIGVNRREERYPFAYTYRDYVVRALNEDLPYDRFIIEQLAADRLKLDKENRWALAGLGFLTVGPRFVNRDYRIFADRIDVISRGLMGMTMMCARCHDHKFDPLSMEDYYGLYGVFESSVEPQYHNQPKLAEIPSDSKLYDQYLQTMKKTEGSYQAEKESIRKKALHDLRAHVGDYLALAALDMGKSSDK
ncbi:MAG: DUF1549 domain-containing protein, partial [Planctomycetales bacterium]